MGVEASAKVWKALCSSEEDYEGSIRSLGWAHVYLLRTWKPLGYALREGLWRSMKGKGCVQTGVTAMITSLVRTWKLYRVRLRRKSLEGFGGPGMSTHRDK